MSRLICKLLLVISLLAGLVLASATASADHRHHYKHHHYKHHDYHYKRYHNYHHKHRYKRRHFRHYNRYHYPRRYSNYWGFYIGPSRYYYANNYYYRRHPRTQEYIVVDKPQGADQVLEVAVAEQVYVYPKNGQSPEEQERDRYDCHVWATEQSGVDPSLADVSAEAILDYRRASNACLEGRGYTVK